MKKLLILILFAALPSLAGTVRTLDGKTLEGDVKLESADALSVIPAKGGKPVTIELANVLQAIFKSAPVKPEAVVRSDDGRPPAPWKLVEVGTLAEKAYARYDARGQYSVKSAGGEIGGKRDAFAFVQQPANGDAELTMKLLDLGTGAPKNVGAGLMFRADAEPDAVFAALVCVGQELRFFKRAKKGESCDGGTVLPGARLPMWLRLSRRGSTFTASVSRDGNQWDQVASEVVDLPPAAMAGFAVCGRERQNTGAHAETLRFASLSPLMLATAPANIPPGLMLRSGTVIANVGIDKLDEAQVRFSKHGDQRVPRPALARIIFSELTPEMAAKIPPRGAGVLLREGDFIEGDLRAYRDGRIELSSVLFGLKRFEPRQQAVAVVLNDLEPARAQLVVRTLDGSIYMTTQLSLDKDQLKVVDPSGATLSFNRWDIADISAGADRMESLASLKPSRVDAPKGAGDGLFSNPMGAGVAMKLAGAPVQNGLAMTAGASASWQLDGKYRLLTFTAGVPSSVLPTAQVRFVVTADGKELYRSAPRASADAPLPVAVSLKDVKSVTLAVQSTLAQPLPTLGLFAEASLVK